MVRKRIVQGVLMPYWRLTRGMTLGAQGVILDECGRVLLVRHGYRPGWHFPGGGVEWNETLEQALAREVFEETGVIIEGRPTLHGMFANFNASRSDHVAVFIVRQWRQPSIPAPTYEIAEQRFFPLDGLPADTNPGTARRLAEIRRGEAPSSHW